MFRSPNPIAMLLLRLVLAGCRLYEQAARSRGAGARLMRALLLRAPNPVAGEGLVTLFWSTIGERLAAAQKLLSRIDPACVIVSEDGVSGPLAVIAAAHGRRIKVLDLPFGYGTQDDFDVALEAKALHGQVIYPAGHHKWLLRLLAPQWLKKGRFQGALIFPPEYVMACEAHGMSVRDAWIVHGGYADRLLAESPQMLDLYRREGIPERKLIPTGTPYSQEMLEGLREDRAASAAFRRARHIEPGRPRILVCWPPSYHAGRGQHSEFPTYREMTRTILGWLADLKGVRVTVSLHPAILREDRETLAVLNLAIDNEYVVRLIPRHDIYVSYFSSTTRWAIAAGKPVVNYDAYGLGLPVYDAAPAFTNARDFSSFKSAILGLTSSAEAFAVAAARQESVAAYWGQLDGRCMERIAAETDKAARH